MPSIFNVLVCILALLIGILIGEKYRKWKKNREENKKGRREGVRVYQFLKKPLTEAFGEEFYDALCAAAERINLP